MAIAHVSTTTGTGDAGSTTLALTAFNCSAGNLIVCGVKWENSVTLSSIADTAGNSYTILTQEVYGTTEPRAALAYAKNITGHATNVITFTFSASAAWRRGCASQYSGADTTAPLDQEATSEVVGTTSVTGPSITTTAANDLHYAMIGLYASETFTDNGTTSPLVGSTVATFRAKLSDTGFFDLVDAGAAGAKTTTVLKSGASISVNCHASFKVATGGGGTIVPLAMHQLMQQGIS